MPDVSVVIPTLGHRRELLHLALRSALEQRDVDVEVVVVLDGHEHEHEASALLRELPVRVVEHGRRRGVSAARNSGIEAATGSWIALLDDDDLFAPTKLRAQLVAAEAADRRWAYTGAVAIDDDHRVLSVEPVITPEALVAELPRRNVIPAGASNVVIRRDLATAVKGFDEQLAQAEDWDYFMQLAAAGPPAHDPSALVAVRHHAGQASLDISALEAALRRFERRHGVRVDHPAILRGAAWTCLEAGNRRGAVRAYAAAVRAGDARSLTRIALAMLPGAVSRRVVSSRRVPAGHRDVVSAQRWIDELVARA